METSNRVKQPSDDQLVFLKQQQEKYAQGSKQWIYLQGHMDQIIADNFLEYVNR